MRDYAGIDARFKRMKMARWLSAAMTCAALAGIAPDAQAQAHGFALDTFDPSERGSDWFSVESLDLRGSWRPAIGVVMDGAYRPLVIYAPDGTIRASVVRNQIFANPGATLVLWDHLRVGFNVPVAVFQDGHTGVLDGVTFSAPATPAVGDLRFGADLRLVGTYGEPFTLALGARVYVPTGERDNYTGDDAVRLDGRLEAAGDLGVFTYAARVGAQYRNLEETLGGSPIGSQLLFGAAAGFRAFDHALIIGPEVYGATVVSHGATLFARQSTPVDAILGAHITFLRDFRIGGGVGPGLTRGFGSPEVRWLASLEWAPAYAEPAPAPAAEPVPADRDGDGIVDENDACPDTPGVKTDDPKTNGCPPDRDGDGVIDSADACPDTPGVKTDDPKTNGCPPDRDGDGVIDSADACPDTPGLKTDDPKTNGCPDPDRDKDGIPNAADACPDVAGPSNADPKKNGCPQAYIQAGQIKIRDQVKFATASAAIVAGKDSQDVLDAVEKLLEQHPEIEQVRVEGHTDSTGSAAFNRTLSQHRAESVVAWLVKHGIDASRLTAQGFGPERPIDDNGTDAGRWNNRRVEFHIVGEHNAPATDF
jgi:outer membrane protein OmpA-like peptidoglycan-associated protein